MQPGLRRPRGQALLLEHCASLEQLCGLRPPRRSPDERLEEILGRKLARGLVAALSGDHGLRPGSLGL